MPYSPRSAELHHIALPLRMLSGAWWWSWVGPIGFQPLVGLALLVPGGSLELLSRRAHQQQLQSAASCLTCLSW